MPLRGPKSRRDYDTCRDSVITGFRMEPDLAKRLCDMARRAYPKGQPNAGDVAATTRRILREQLGWNDADAESAEAGPFPKTMRGIKVEDMLLKQLERAGHKLGLTPMAAARHHLRVALGVPAEESLEREERFASIAELRGSG